MGGLARWLGLLLLLGVLAAGLGAGAVYHLFERPGPAQTQTVVVIPKGAGLSDIARLLDESGVASGFVFKLGARVTGNHARLRAGEYAFPPGASAHEVMDRLVAGETVVRRLTVPEGLTSAQVAASVNAAYGLMGDPVPPPPEGSVLPDTYHYSYGDMRSDVIARMRHAMDVTLQTLWADRAEGLPFDDPREAVVLASIVEKETGLARERALVAGVFVNRLGRDMPLQSDPTVAYAAAKAAGREDNVLDRTLTRKDLETPDPYNTYLNRGLPPGPIANPGREAIAATLHPAETSALYFVADGTGGHVFSDTLQEHNRNVRRWRRLQRNSDAPAAP